MLSGVVAQALDSWAAQSSCFERRNSLPPPSGQMRKRPLPGALIAIARSTVLLASAGTMTTGLASPRFSSASEARRTAVVKAVEEARDSVVNIHGQKTVGADEDPLLRGDGPHKVNGMGTGIVIDERGYII